MNSKCAKIFSLVIYIDKSEAWDIIPFDSIILSENPLIGEVLLRGEKCPLKIVATSENIDYLTSIVTEDDIYKTLNLPPASTDCNIVQMSTNITEKETEENVTKDTTIYPFMIQKNKVELLSESNVWICKRDLVKINKKFVPQKFTRVKESIVHDLLEKLIGLENMKCMSFGGKSNSTNVPAIVYSTIKKYLEQNSQKKNEFSNYDKLVKKVLLQTKTFAEYKTLPVLDSENNEGIRNIDLNNQQGHSFPCRVRDKNKVKLLRKCIVWIDKNDRILVEKMCKEAPVDKKKIVAFLLTNLLGSGNIKYTNVNGSTCIQIPEVVYTSIFIFLNEKCSKHCKFLEDEFDSYIQMLYKKSREIMTRKIQSEETTTADQFIVSASTNKDYSKEYFKFVPSEVQTVFKTKLNVSSHHITIMSNNCSNVRVMNSVKVPKVTPLVTYSSYSKTTPLNGQLQFQNNFGRQTISRTSNYCYQDKAQFMPVYQKQNSTDFQCYNNFTFIPPSTY